METLTQKKILKDKRMIFSKKQLLTIFSIAIITLHQLSAMNTQKLHALNNAALMGELELFNIIWDQTNEDEIQELIFAADEWDWTMLHHAVANISSDKENITRRILIIKKILAAAKDRAAELIIQQKIDKETALHIAALGSHIEFINILLKAFATIDPNRINNLLTIKNNRSLTAFNVAEIRKNEDVMNALRIREEK
jgi:ankyrin repeat protein